MGIGRGEGPEAVELGFEIAPQLERIETVVECFELVTFRWGQDAGSTKPLVRGLGAIVNAVNARARAGLRHELLHGLEEVDVQPSAHVDATKLSIGGLGGEAIIADELADDGAVSPHQAESEPYGKRLPGRWSLARLSTENQRLLRVFCRDFHVTQRCTRARGGDR